MELNCTSEYKIRFENRTFQVLHFVHCNIINYRFVRCFKYHFSCSFTWCNANIIISSKIYILHAHSVTLCDASTADLLTVHECMHELLNWILTCHVFNIEWIWWVSKLILQLSVSEGDCSVTKWVHEKSPKNHKSHFLVTHRGPKQARFAINHKTWPHGLNVDAHANNST